MPASRRPRLSRPELIHDLAGCPNSCHRPPPASHAFADQCSQKRLGEGAPSSPWSSTAFTAYAPHLRGIHFLPFNAASLQCRPASARLTSPSWQRARCHLALVCQHTRGQHSVERQLSGQAQYPLARTLLAHFPSPNCRLLSCHPRSTRIHLIACCDSGVLHRWQGQ